MKKIMFGFISLLLVISVSACNFFILPKHGHENINDSRAQISNIFAYQNAKGEVTAQFSWRYPLRIDDVDDRIKEAVLAYSVGAPLPLRFVPFPTDKGGVVNFTFEDGQYLYSKTIDGLSKGDDVYFALYPRTEKQWLAPLFEKITVRDPDDIPLVVDATQYSAEPLFQFYTDGYIFEIESGSGQYWLSSTNLVLLRFELPDKIHCTNAQLTLPAFAGTGIVYPITFKYIEWMGDDERLSTIDVNNTSAVADFNLPSLDVTEAVNAAIVYGSDALLVETTADVGPFTYNPSTPTEYLTITYQEF